MILYDFILFLYDSIIIIITIIIIIIISIITLEVGHHFSNVPSFLNINLFPDFERPTGLLTFFRKFRLPPNFSNVPFFLNMNVSPDFERSAGFFIIILATVGARGGGGFTVNLQ